jgi:glycosyltransferase involved in cell wall biosynthesis
MRALQNVNVILAAADEDAIMRLVVRSNGALSRERIIGFPTSVDTEVFFPTPKDVARRSLGLNQEDVILASIGRLSKVKGWRLLLEAFSRWCNGGSHGQLLFVGDGEDRHLVLGRARELGIASQVRITGIKGATEVSQYLNAADLIVVGSDSEGWSLSMLEALACGRPIVSTPVSGARAMVRNGENGYVIDHWNADEFSLAITRALKLHDATRVAREIAESYSTRHLASRLESVWPYLAAKTAMLGVSSV